MPKAQPYDTYYGGKSGAGTYQTIINRIPECSTFMSLCLGNCGITANIRPAKLMILNDIDPEVINAWEPLIGSKKTYRLLSMDVVELLRSVIAEKFDTAATFIYIDPPYSFTARKGQVPVYRYEMADDEHRALIAAAKALKHARVMISHYPCELYDQGLNGWHTHDYESTTRAGLALERLYMNYQPGDELHDYQYIGDNFREREQMQRMYKNHFKKMQRMQRQFPKLYNWIMQDLPSLAQNSDVGQGDRLPARIAKDCDVISLPADHLVLSK